MIDFRGQVYYEAFRKIIDYFYLNDLSVLDAVKDSSEILEIIKLSKIFNLTNLFKAAESYFQEIMFLWFENHSVFSLKPSKIASMQQSKRGVIQIKKPEIDP